MRANEEIHGLNMKIHKLTQLNKDQKAQLDAIDPIHLQDIIKEKELQIEILELNSK